MEARTNKNLKVCSVELDPQKDLQSLWYAMLVLEQKIRACSDKESKANYSSRAKAMHDLAKRMYEGMGK